MVHGYHLILVTYGAWLPNDPRGSWSDYVASWELFKYGPATRSDFHKSLLNEPDLMAKRRAAQQGLKYPPVVLSGQQARSAGVGFGNLIRKSRLTVWACAILPEHTHMVIARGRLSIERMANLLKGEATKQLHRDGLHPLAKMLPSDDRVPSPWARNQWKVFLDDEASIEDAIEYVEQNPRKEGKPRQKWTFVQPFQGLGPGIVSYQD